MFPREETRYQSCLTKEVAWKLESIWWETITTEGSISFYKCGSALVLDIFSHSCSKPRRCPGHWAWEPSWAPSLIFKIQSREEELLKWLLWKPVISAAALPEQNWQLVRQRLDQAALFSPSCLRERKASSSSAYPTCVCPFAGWGVSLLCLSSFKSYLVKREMPRLELAGSCAFWLRNLAS